MPETTASLALPATLATAGMLGLVYLILSVRVIQGRYRHRVALGDAGNPELAALIRAHGNFAEYVPLLLVLMALVEVSGGPLVPLAGCGAALVAARVAHAVGMAIPRVPNPWRAVGTVLTLLLLPVLSLWSLLLALD